MATDPRVVCVDTDTGLFSEADAQAAGARYLQLGIAEHTAMGVAAALAAAGLRPFVNTMATFAATRAPEAVKINIAQNALPVRIVATHGGVAAGHLGPTHHALEDLAIMRALPKHDRRGPGGRERHRQRDRAGGGPGWARLRAAGPQAHTRPAGRA
jgi:transketolase